MEKEVKNEDLIVEVDSKKQLKKKLTIIGIVIGMILVIGVCGLFGYKMYVSSPINLYRGVVDEGYETLSDFIEEIYESETFDLSKDTLVMDGSLKLSTNLEELNDYTKHSYKFNFGLDAKNKKLELGGAINEEEKEVISGIMYVLDKTMYISSKQVYDKVLYQVMEEDIFSELMTEEGMELPLTHEEADRLVEKVAKYINDSFDKSKFKEEKAVVKIDGKDVKVTKVIYPINNDTMYHMTSSILKDMKNDSEFIKLVSKLIGSTTEEVEAMFDGMKVSKDDFAIEEEVDFYLYTKGFFSDVVGFGLEENNDVISYIKVKDKAELVLEGEEFKFVAKTNGDKTVGSLVVDKEELLTFDLVYKENDKNQKIDLNLKYQEADESFTIKLSTDSTEESEKKASSKVSVFVSVTTEGETVELGADVEVNVEIGGKVNGIDTNGAVNYEDLTETDFEAMENNLIKALEGTALYDLLIVSNEPDYEYDYEYDYSEDI
ncbi:MAG: hypothetical protein E7162_02845 [Firmicutes bacterium]|nr:hypothetical protein [Bacillota bacterium]